MVALLAAAILLAALADATRRSADAWSERSVRLAADGRAQAATAAEVWRTRFDTTVNRWRTRSRLDQIELERRPALQALGEAVWGEDSSAETAARERLTALEAERQRIEEEHAEHLAGAEERIRNARLPVQDTLMVTPKVKPRCCHIPRRTRASPRSRRRCRSRIRLRTRERRRRRLPTPARRTSRNPQGHQRRR